MDRKSAAEWRGNSPKYRLQNMNFAFGCMLVFWICLESLSGLAECALQNVTDTPVWTLSPPIYDNITLSPSIKENYTLYLSTSGPAVLDSWITFRANLTVSPEGSSSQKFCYTWITDAEPDRWNRTRGRLLAQVRQIFSKNRVKPGEYSMQVIVSPTCGMRQILAFKLIKFTLTDTLNGNVDAHQALIYQRQRNIFAVGKPVELHINVTDRFNHKHVLDSNYFWYNHTNTSASTLIVRTKEPFLKYNFSTVGTMVLDAETFLRFTGVFRVLPLNSNEKHGLFKQHLIFKEELSSCSSSRLDSQITDQSVKLGSPVVLNITCIKGSSPSAVCWNVTVGNATLNETCRPGTFINTTQHQISVTLQQSGWQTVQLAIYNDVSYQTFNLTFYAYDAGTINIPALVFPIVFIIIGIVIAVAGAAYLMRLRRTLHVEVADFDFHPSLSSRNANVISTIAAGIKQLIHRIRHDTFRDPDLVQVQVDGPESLYDSL